jgi:hypothetical protein
MFELAGIEEATVEIEGTIPEEAARRILGRTGLAPEIAAPGQARIGVLLFRMSRLGPRALAGKLGLSYGEALFRVGTTLGGVPAWACPACDLDRAPVRALGRWIVRYPTVAARIAIDDRGEVWRAYTAAAGETLEVSARIGGVRSVRTPRRAIVIEGARIFQIPWREEPGAWCRAADAEVVRDARARTALALLEGEPITWEREALVLRGRRHVCGVARRVAP